MVKFVISGEPVGKGRPRFVKKTGRTYTPDKTVFYENLVRQAYRSKYGTDRFLINQAVSVEIVAYFAMPKSASKAKRERMLNDSSCESYVTKKPDADNIAKIICDSLNVVAWHDDSQVADCRVQKRWAEQGRIEVLVRQL
ncbi:MAG: RusA family crossover junction endodeoxyribonuclease [Oscillospiraceae bacterium]|jgi:Holliday junction resolvase RusA-like endonuclease|nr:RusA family crossover junction endodeoxyribonuclease [Oscillospiraceae bacterium]